MPKSSHSSKKRSTAQAMVEFALALPVLLLVVYGLLETGRLLFMYASVVTAARQAARYGSATGDNGSGVRYYNDCNGIIAAARRLQFIQVFDSIDISYDHPGTTWNPSACPIPANPPGHPANGDRIRVTVTSTFNPIVPLVPLRAFPITSTSNRTLLVGASIAITNPGQGFTGGGTQGLSLTKHATQDTYDHIGEVITYQYTLQNTSTTDITGPFTITDDRIGTFQCGPSGLVLAAGSAVYNCANQTYTIVAGDITSPEVTNRAIATNGDGSVSSNQAVYTISFLPDPHITLTKAATVPGTVDANAIVNYSFTILNDGNMPLQAPYSITDTLIGNDWTCPGTPATLAIGSTVVCTGTYRLKNTDINNGGVTNTASATVTNGTSTVTSDEVTVVTPIPILLLQSIDASPNPFTAVGQTVTITYRYRNRGTKTLSNLTVTNSNSAIGPTSCTGTLAAGASGSCQQTYVTTQADLDAGGITSNVTVSGTQSSPAKTWVSNVEVLTIPATQAGAIQLTETASPSEPAPPATSLAVGTTITYHFALKNIGNITIKAPYVVTVTDDARLGTINCSGATSPLAPGASTTCTDKPLQITQADQDAGRLINHSTATASPNSGVGTVTPGNSSATVITWTEPRYVLVKTADKTNFSDANEVITYTYGLKNTGGAQALTTTAFVLHDDKLAVDINCGAGNIGVGATLVCGTRTYTTTADDVAALSVINTLSVVSGTATGTSGAAPTASNVTVRVPLLRCDTTTLFSDPIASGSNPIWNVTNHTGTDLHLSVGTISWDPAGVNMLQIFVGLQQVFNSTASSVMTINGTGWPAIPYDTAGATSITLKFSASATNIQIHLVFTETPQNRTCEIYSSP